MCLIVVAHRASLTFPLVIAANRDEDYTRPSRPASLWEEGDIAGGRDELHGGSWLAIARDGRFAAVTNVRAATKPPSGRSRGELVVRFVRGTADPRAYAEESQREIEQYGGFHLLVGQAGGELVQLSGSVEVLPPGIHGLSNAPAGLIWPKVESAAAALRGALEATAAETMAGQLLRMLRAETHRDVTRDHFVRGERYGTRASTAIIVHGGRVLFVEQNYGPGGVAAGARTTIEFTPGGKR
jgi:uncharacterized protein with NRDE domain